MNHHRQIFAQRPMPSLEPIVIETPRLRGDDGGNRQDNVVARCSRLSRQNRARTSHLAVPLQDASEKDRFWHWRRHGAMGMWFLKRSQLSQEFHEFLVFTVASLSLV